MNYYKILGVNKNTPDDEIRKRYKILARKYHPDKNPNRDTSKKFKEVTEAYKILSNPHTRSKYDLMSGKKEKTNGKFNNIDMSETFEMFNDIFSIFRNNSYFNKPFIDGKPFFKNDPFKNFPPINTNNTSSQSNSSTIKETSFFDPRQREVNFSSRTKFPENFHSNFNSMPPRDLRNVPLPSASGLFNQTSSQQTSYNNESGKRKNEKKKKKKRKKRKKNKKYNE
uniref:DnaJ domain protein n=1 Tax=Mimivirus LCMiAC02 TaxID=2506609 RepID=A0A4P6VMG9_9VIRU|nr:MAG: DnaJ domain protein [Mimivirus LCMiAC02]